MRPFDYDDDDLDEFEFESFAANRRPHRSKSWHHKAAGHKRQKAVHHDRWENDDWEAADLFEEYNELEFDDCSGITTRY